MVPNLFKSELNLLLSTKNATSSGAPYGSNPVSTTPYNSSSEEEWRASSLLETEEIYPTKVYNTSLNKPEARQDISTQLLWEL